MKNKTSPNPPKTLEAQKENPPEQKYSNIQLIKDLWHFVKNKKLEFFILTIGLAIAALLGLVPPIIIAKIIDYFVQGGTEARVFYLFLVTLLGVMVAENTIDVGTKYYFNLFTIKIQKQLKVESMQKVLQGDLLWHDKENTGNKMQRVQEGERAIEEFLRFYANQAVSMVITIIGIISVFAFFNIKYAVIGVLYLVIYMSAELKLNKRLAEKVKALKIAQEQASGKAYEFSSNISTVKSLGIEKSSQSQILSKEEEVLEARKERRKASTQKWMVVELISTLFFVIFLFFVGRDVILSILTVGSIVIYVEYIRKLSLTLYIFSNFINFLIEGKFGIARMMEIHRAVQPFEEKATKSLEEWKNITIKDVSFNYKEESVLKDMNLKIERGQKIGIVGKSGSGKSTLFKLLLKLYLPKKGEIYFDNTEIRNLNGDSILKKISVVPQETELFNLSLKDNVTISETNSVNKEKYQTAVSISQVDKIINKLQNRDLSIIGEKGIRLSGGERQRIGIARAIYKDSDIIILDESTSNLDYTTEKNILEKMESQLKDKTLIISAHRLETLKNMDNILFIEKGKIVEQGTYTELSNKNGKFAKLLKEQKTRKVK